MTGDLIPISDEQAKLGQEIIKAFDGLGSFLSQALGSTPEDLIGYLGGDWLRFRRAENIARLLSEARERLAARGVEQPKPASLTVALPILRGGADEDRDVLIDLWARLLANAMDPNLSSVRHQFISAVQAMDPPDARTLNYLYSAKTKRIVFGGGGDSVQTTVEYISKRLGVEKDEVEVSLRHLETLRLLTTTPQEANVWFPNADMREFMRACYPELSARG
jgi:hypothetical protein